MWMKNNGKKRDKKERTKEGKERRKKWIGAEGATFHSNPGNGRTNRASAKKRKVEVFGMKYFVVDSKSVNHEVC